MSSYESRFRFLRHGNGWAVAVAGLALITLLSGWLAGQGLAAESEIMPNAVSALLLDGQVLGERLIVVGERGHILISDDQGRTWQQQPAPTRATLTSVFFVDPDNGWAAGHDAVILRTQDGGRHWQQVYADVAGERPILDLWFRDLQHGYAVGGYGLFLATADGGASWQPVDFSPATLRVMTGPLVDPWSEEPAEESWGIDYHLNQVAVSADGRMFIAAEGGKVYRSDDACHSWVSLPSPYEGSFYGSLPLHNGHLLLFGLRGHLFHSEDAGANWTELPSGAQATLNDGLRLRDGRIVLVGLAGTLLVSTDAGEHFSLFAQSDRAGISKVLETKDGALVLIGEQGVKRVKLPGRIGEGAQ